MKKAISILLAICIFIMPVGCSSNKTLTTRKASGKMPWNYFLVLHTPKNVYDLYNYKYKKGNLTGWLRKSSCHNNGKTFDVYTNQELNIDTLFASSQKVFIEKSNIALTSRKELQQRKTILTIGIISFLFVIAILFPGKGGGGFFDKQTM